MVILDYYIEKTLKVYKPGQSSSVIYDSVLFNRLIPNSCLAKELLYVFVELPFKMFLADGNPNTDYDIYDHENHFESVFTDPGKLCTKHHVINNKTGFVEHEIWRAGLYETE
jgi:hypothetical protein